MVRMPSYLMVYEMPHPKQNSNSGIRITFCQFIADSGALLYMCYLVSTTFFYPFCENWYIHPNVLILNPFPPLCQSVASDYVLGHVYCMSSATLGDLTHPFLWKTFSSCILVPSFMAIDAHQWRLWLLKQISQR